MSHTTDVAVIADKYARLLTGYVVLMDHLVGYTVDQSVDAELESCRATVDQWHANPLPLTCRAIVVPLAHALV